MSRITILVLSILWLQGCSGEKSIAKKSLFNENWDTATTIGSKIRDLDVTNYYSDNNSTYLSFNESKGNFGYRFETNKNIEQLNAKGKTFWEPQSADSKKLYKDITGDDFLEKILTLDNSWVKYSKAGLNLVRHDKVTAIKEIQTGGSDAMIVVSWDLAGTTYMALPDQSPIMYPEAFCYINTDARDEKLWIKSANCEAHISKKQIPALKEVFSNFANEFHNGKSPRLEEKLYLFIDNSFSSDANGIEQEIAINSQPNARWKASCNTSKSYQSDDGTKILDFSFALYGE